MLSKRDRALKIAILPLLAVTAALHFGARWRGVSRTGNWCYGRERALVDRLLCMAGFGGSAGAEHRYLVEAWKRL